MMDKDGRWHDFFAWLPVEVDAYEVSELRNGRTRFKVWLKLIRRRWDKDLGDNGLWRYGLISERTK